LKRLKKKLEEEEDKGNENINNSEIDIYDFEK
jgi:hypothetical protein